MKDFIIKWLFIAIMVIIMNAGKWVMTTNVTIELLRTYIYFFSNQTGHGIAGVEAYDEEIYADGEEYPFMDEDYFDEL